MLIYRKPKLYTNLQALNAANCDEEKQVNLNWFDYIYNTIWLNNYITVQQIKKHWKTFHVICYQTNVVTCNWYYFSKQ